MRVKKQSKCLVYKLPPRLNYWNWDNISFNINAFFIFNPRFLFFVFCRNKWMDTKLVHIYFANFEIDLFALIQLLQMFRRSLEFGRVSLLWNNLILPGLIWNIFLIFCILYFAETLHWWCPNYNIDTILFFHFSLLAYIQHLAELYYLSFWTL